MGSRPYQPSTMQPVTVESQYKYFKILPEVCFWWKNEDGMKDRSVTIGWLCWEIDISLNILFQEW